MTKKIIRLTESELIRFVKRVVKEQVGTGMDNLSDTEKDLYGKMTDMMADNDPKTTTTGDILNAQDQKRQREISRTKQEELERERRNKKNQERKKLQGFENFAEYFVTEMSKKGISKQDLKPIKELIYFSLSSKTQNRRPDDVWNSFLSKNRERIKGIPDFETAKRIANGDTSDNVFYSLMKMYRLRPDEDYKMCFIEKVEPKRSGKFRTGALLCKPEFATQFEFLPTQKLLSEFFAALDKS